MDAEVRVGHEGWSGPFPGLYGVVGFDVAIDCCDRQFLGCLFGCGVNRGVEGL